MNEHNERFKKISVYIILCAAIAVLSCFAAEQRPRAVRAVMVFVGDSAVLSMFSLYFPLAAGSLCEAHPERRGAVFCAADAVSLTLKIAFAALCAKSGGVMIHAAALVVDCIFSRICVLKSVKIQLQIISVQPVEKSSDARNRHGG